jgi:hypothetical protein
MIPDLIAMHMGALHPYEKALTLLLAFGPFVVLGSVIGLRRRHESDDETTQQSTQQSADVHQSA